MLLSINTLFKLSIFTFSSGIASVAFIKPASAYEFTGLRPSGVRGTSEFRSIFGGLFIGLGIAPFFLGEPAFKMLGIGYLAIAVARTFSILFDKSYEKSNIISLVIEVVLGIILIF